MASEWCRASLGWSYADAVLALSVAAPVMALFLHATGQRLLPGAARAAVALPCVLLNLLLAKLFCRWTDINTTILISFNLGWLSNFKILSWALNRGALCAQRFTPAQFVAVYALPITPLHSADDASAAAAPVTPSGPAAGTRSRTHGDGSAKPGGSSASLASGATSQGDAPPPAALPRRGSRGRLADDAGGPGRMAQNWAGKNLLLGVCLVALRHQLPGFIESFILGLGLYVLLSLIMDGPAALVVGLAGLRVSPHFDKPWLSTSVASFWSKRWDLAAGNTLRQLVFDCVLDGSLLPPPAGASHPRPSALRQALGTAAAFAASGLIHEGIFWYITGRTSGGSWFAFFAVQAPLIVLERLILAALKRQGVRVPTWARTAATYLLVVGTAQHLFWAPTKAAGVAEAAVTSTRNGMLGCLALARRWARRAARAGSVL